MRFARRVLFSGGQIILDISQIYDVKHMILSNIRDFSFLHVCSLITFLSNLDIHSSQFLPNKQLSLPNWSNNILQMWKIKLRIMKKLLEESQ